MCLWSFSSSKDGHFKGQSLVIIEYPHFFCFFNLNNVCYTTNIFILLFASIYLLILEFAHFVIQIYIDKPRT